MKIAWYPGHIAKTKKEIENNIKKIDVVIEVIDARCPMSTISPYVKSLTKNKKHLIVCAKSDLVSSNDIKEVKRVLNNYGVEYILLDNRDNTIKNVVDKKIDKLLADLILKYNKKGILNYSFKAMVVGMPNVGKSTFINSYVKKKALITGDKAGVTKTLQWVKLSSHLMLLDTPGITLPKFEDEKVGTNLAYIGSINDDIVDKYELACELIGYLNEHYKKELYNRYKIENEAKNIICIIARNTGAIKKGNSIDIDKVSRLVIDDFRKCKIGKIYLEN